MIMSSKWTDIFFHLSFYRANMRVILSGSIKYHSTSLISLVKLYFKVLCGNTNIYH